MKFSRFMSSHTRRSAEKDKPTSALLLGPKESSPKTKPSSLRRFTSDWWSWEISSIALSLACSVALIVILNKYHSQPVPQWRHGITLNAIISILATAAKGALLLSVAEAISQYKWLWFQSSQRKLQDIVTFDNASRGPWGAFTMLLKIHIRDIASLGALITVLSWAFDPFMQQVVVYRLRSVPKNTAAIGRSQAWLPNPNDILDNNYISLSEKAAFYNGLFNENAAPQLTPTCATGNCTWLPVSTLAFCSKCEDVTSTSPVKCNLTSTVGAYDYGSTIGSCSVNIPGVPSFNYSGSSNPADSSSTIMQFLSIGTIGQNGHESIAGTKGPYGGFTRVSFAAINSPKVTNVTTCVMFPCVKTYNLSVTDGNLVSAEISMWYNETGIDYNVIGNFSLTPPAHESGNTTKGTPFIVEWDTSLQIATLLYNSFNGNVQRSTMTGWDFSSDYIQVAYAAKDLGQLTRNLADSLTNYIRNSSSVPYYGTAWGTETYVHVRWIWLILPMALAPMSLIFLFSAIWVSSHQDIRVWKSSGLATVFHGLERPIETQDLSWQSDMDELSKEIRVRLQQTDGKAHNLMLSGSKFTPLGRQYLSRAAAGDELEHIAPTHPSTGDGNGTHKIPRRPVGSSVSPGKPLSRSTPL